MDIDFNMLSEDIIIEMAQKRDDSAMTYLMEKYKSLVRKKARPLFLIGGDKDDLIQEGMIGLYKAVCNYSNDREASFRTFAEMCISRQIYSAIKSSNRRKNMPLNTYISIYAPEFNINCSSNDGGFMLDMFNITEKNPEEIIIDKENEGFLQKQLFKKLSGMEKEVLNKYLNGMTYQEIALEMDKTPKSIDNALQRIKSKMKQVTIQS